MAASREASKSAGDGPGTVGGGSFRIAFSSSANRVLSFDCIPLSAADLSGMAWFLPRPAPVRTSGRPENRTSAFSLPPSIFAIRREAIENRLGRLGQNKRLTLLVPRQGRSKGK
jgi:hypothetical protein